MLRRVVWLACLAVVLTVPLAAQEKRVEASVLFGWTFSDGVELDTPAVFPAGVFDRVDPKDSFKWSILGSVHATENFEIGFQYGQQDTQLEALGTTEIEVSDIRVSTYHGFFGYNAFGENAIVRPYAMLGFGATNFGEIDFDTTGGRVTTTSDTQFSTTWGAGVKIFPSPSFGFRAGVQWTPTYIKTDAEGWWCDPWWGCYVVGDAQYSSQWDLNGGVVVRF